MEKITDTITDTLDIISRIEDKEEREKQLDIYRDFLNTFILN